MSAAAESEPVPTPGSNVALAKGCTCPVLDNEMGRGMGGDGPDALYWINGDCPLHGNAAAPELGELLAPYRERRP